MGLLRPKGGRVVRGATVTSVVTLFAMKQGLHQQLTRCVSAS